MTQTLDVRISSGADDSEEALSTGVIKLSSGDLEFGFTGPNEQITGLRFNGIDIPQGAFITNAYIQFQADETGSTPSLIEFRGEDSDNALAFSSQAFDISSRADTGASVSWSPAAWTSVGEAGADQRTPDLSAIIQEIIDRPGWAPQNALAITATGSGERGAESYEGNAATAPLLHIEYSFTNTPTLSVAATLDASEPGAGGLFTVSLSSMSDSDTVIGYTVTGSAIPGSQTGADYQPLPGSITIAAGSLSAPIPVNVFDDPDVEGDETVILTLDNQISSGDAGINVNTSPATLTISDDDTPPVTGTRFWAIADTPYNTSAETALTDFMNTVPVEVEFVIHLGDIKPGSDPSTNPDPYQNVSGILQQSSVPVFIIPGDNEYNDTVDPDAAWINWEANFGNFNQNWTHSFNVNYQFDRPENFSFVSDDVVFIGINLVGGTYHDSQEWATRSADDLAWIESNFAQFGDAVSSAVVFGHAFPGLQGYETFEAGFIAAAQSFADPILYMQGDNHQWLIDQPYSEAPNISRVIVDQTGGSADPLLVSVSNDPGATFTFDHDFIA